MGPCPTHPFNKPWRSLEPIPACSSCESGRVGKGGWMKVPEPGDLSGLRPLFDPFGLFSHLNPIKPLITWSQSSLGTLRSPGCGDMACPAVYPEVGKSRWPGGQLSLPAEDQDPRPENPHSLSGLWEG